MSKRKIKSIIVVFLLCLVLNIKNGTIFAAQTEKSCYDVLLVEDTLPWDSDANSRVLKGEGISYKKVKTDDFLTEELGNYSVIVFANDQGFSTYSNYAKFMGNIESFASLGGVVVFGACDGGWASGRITSDLPGGVKKISQLARNNYICDNTHPIITGELTDNEVMVDEDLYSNSCSHIVFDEKSLPKDSNIILRDSKTRRPTLVEYKIGSGMIIASGLTWEHNYENYPESAGAVYGNFAEKALGDMFKYALENSNANVNMKPPIALSVTGEEQIKEDDCFSINAKIKNIGNAEATNVKLSILSPEGCAFSRNSGRKFIKRELLGIGDSDSIEWKIEIRNKDLLSEKEKEFSFLVKLEYTDPKTGEKETKEIVKKVKVIRKNRAIIVVPGIMGSNLKKNDNNKSVWADWLTAGNPEDVPKIISAFDSLECSDDGESKKEMIAENDYGFGNIYENILVELQEKCGKVYDVKFFAYDWRKSVGKLADDLKKYIEDYDEVVFVAHSMGGLVTESYIAKYDGAKVDKQITAGTPFWGTPVMLNVLNTGDLGYILDINFLEKVFLRTALPLKLRNFESCYDLLPNEIYTEKASLTPVYDLVGTLIGTNIINYDFKKYDEHINKFYNEDLWKRAKDNHKSIYDRHNKEKKEKKIKRIALVGYGETTIVRNEKDRDKNDVEYYIPIYSKGGGDGVVTTFSATMNYDRELLDIKLFANKDHRDLIEDGECTEYISNMINSDERYSKRSSGLGSASEADDSLQEILNNRVSIDGEYDFYAENNAMKYSYISGYIKDGEDFKIDVFEFLNPKIILSQFIGDDYIFEFTSLKEQVSDVEIYLNGAKLLYEGVDVKENTKLYLNLKDEMLKLEIDIDADGVIDKKISSNDDTKDEDIREEDQEEVKKEENLENNFYVESRNANIANLNTINPNIIVTNNLMDEVLLKDLLIVYTFNPDGKEEFDFCCDWIAVNNKTIDGKVKCDFKENDDESISAEIGFNTCDKIKKEDKLSIHFRIHSKDWSDMNFENDYSMGTEKMNKTDRIVVKYRE